MKKILAILILIFFLQTPSWADDIRDFQIEGISIGDSLLDYITTDEIEKRKFFYKGMTSNPKKFASLNLFSDDIEVEIYNKIKIDFKNSDSKYKIYALGGIIYYDIIKDRYNKKDEIVAELANLFKEARKEDAGTRKHYIDKSGESTTTDFVYWFRFQHFIILASIFPRFINPFFIVLPGRYCNSFHSARIWVFF